MNSRTWYAQLRKPSWAPPARIFGPVWSVLYILIAVSFGFVLIQFLRNQIEFIIIIPFILNVVFNALFSPIQWGLRNNLLAAVDVLLVWGTLVWAMIAIYPEIQWVAYMQIPYLCWVSFASVLQITITAMNWNT